MKVEFTTDFQKDLLKVKDKILLSKIKDVIEQVEKANNLREVPNVKKIKAKGDYYRIKIASYRIGIFLEQNSLVFARFLHRKEIYRYFP